MATTYFCLLTQEGENDVAAALTPGGAGLGWTQFAVGDSGGAYYDPTGDETALVDEKWRGDINKIYVAPNNPDQLIVEAYIPIDQGGFEIREAGVFDAAGDMVAIGKYPLTEKPAQGSGSEKDLYVRMVLNVANAAGVAQTIDPSVVLATQKYVDARMIRFVKAATTGDVADLAAGAPDSVDGVALAAGDRVLVMDQATKTQNGIYSVTSVGSGTDGAWVRASDFDAGAEIYSGSLVSVEKGTAYGDSLWMLTTDNPITIDTSDIVFSLKLGSVNIEAGSYTKVTVNAQGQVTAGANPTTLEGYGIKDAETPAGAQAKADAVQGNLNTHAESGAAHGATADATANAIIRRDANKQAKVGVPTENDHIARKVDVDGCWKFANGVISLGSNYLMIKYPNGIKQITMRGNWDVATSVYNAPHYTLTFPEAFSSYVHIVGIGTELASQTTAQDNWYQFYSLTLQNVGIQCQHGGSGQYTTSSRVVITVIGK